MRRLNGSITARLEKSLLESIIPQIPTWVSPDHLTLIALLSSFVGGTLYIYVEKYPIFLLGINVCLFIHWLTDSLDGKLARFRKKTRDRYGYYIDHMFDSISAAFFIGGISTSNLTHTTGWVWVLSFMLLSMIHVFLKNKVYGVLELSVQQLGPTEARLGLFGINLLLFFIGNPLFTIHGIQLTVLDIIGWVVVVGFVIVLVPEIVKTLIRLESEDKKLERI